MKITTLLGFALCAVLTLNSANAQNIPTKINYQAVARNAAGATLQNQNVGIRFTIHSGSPTGTTAYQETHALKTNQFGLFTAYIGDGEVTQGNKQSIDWGNAEQYLQVEMDAAGGTNYTDMGTTQFVSVPYAVQAGKAIVADRLQLPYHVTGDGSFSIIRVIDTTTRQGSNAIYGESSATGGFNAGVIGVSKSLSTFSAGVAGEAYYNGVRGRGGSGLEKPDQPVYGVMGQSYNAFDYSAGVFGRAEIDSGMTFGLHGESRSKNTTSAGVFGQGANGVIGVASDSMGAGVVARTDARTDNRAALEVSNGYIKVTGSNKTAFVHTVTAANKKNGTNSSELDYPGMAASDILIATRVGQAAAAGSFSVSLIGGKWNVSLDDAAKTLPAGDMFNILVIKQ